MSDTEEFIDDGNASHTWTPVDLSDVLDGSWKPPTPTVSDTSTVSDCSTPARNTPCQVNPRRARRRLALAACRDEILRGNHVLYVDFEDDKGPVVNRLMMLGVNAERVAAFFHYIRPETPIFLAPNPSDVT